MKRCLGSLPHLAGLLFLLAPPAAAQDWSMPWSDPRDRPSRFEISFSGGVLTSPDWSTLTRLGSISPVSGVLEQVVVRDLRLESGALYSGALTYWRDRAGLRVQAGFSRSRLMTANASAAGATSSIGGDMVLANVNTWLYDARAIIGLVPYTPTRRALPYVFLGAGGMTYDLSRTVTPPLFTFVQGGTPTPTGNLAIWDNGSQFLLSANALSIETQFAVNVGGGADLRIPMGASALGVRIEVADHVARSPVELSIRGLDPGGSLTSETVVDFGLRHNLSAVAGVVFQFGR